MADRAAAVAAGARVHSRDDPTAETAVPRGPAGAVVGALAGLGEHGSLTPLGCPRRPSWDPTSAPVCLRKALSHFGAERFRGSPRGDSKAVAELAAQEPNLRHACRLAGEKQWWDPVAGIAEGLGALYQADGRLGEWEEMVEGCAHCAPITLATKPYRAASGCGERSPNRKSRFRDSATVAACRATPAAVCRLGPPPGRARSRGCRAPAARPGRRSGSSARWPNRCFT